MAKATTIQLKKSNVVTDEGNPKLPTPDQLEYGELAVNYVKGGETISLKNSENEIATFKSYPELRLISESGAVILTVPYAKYSLANENGGSYYYNGTSAVGLGEWDEEGEMPTETQEVENSEEPLVSE